mmetsp:Transcript_29113/g.70307  ORF Transcript_29113/g.70307 Transcript_29113/m.70307 type:complete len:92 (-) Transcript_29113:37-312(-)
MGGMPSGKASGVVVMQHELVRSLNAFDKEESPTLTLAAPWTLQGGQGRKQSHEAAVFSPDCCRKASKKLALEGIVSLVRTTSYVNIDRYAH